jgi:hypothetical protein
VNESLPPFLRAYVASQADAMGLPGPDDYLLLLQRLEQQRQSFAGVDARYREVFSARRPAA